MPSIRWPQVVAGALVIAGAAVLGLLLHSFEPEPLSERQLAATRAKFVANCGEGMFDVSPQSVMCPAFDAIVLESWPCAGCEAFALTLHAEGRATLGESFPFDGATPSLRADIGQAEFRRLANLVAAMQFDRVGGYVAPAPHAGNAVLKAGCGGEWSFSVNHGGGEEDAAAVTRCLLAVKQRADWSQR